MIPFLDPIIFLASFQLIEMLIVVLKLDKCSTFMASRGGGGGGGGGYFL